MGRALFKRLELFTRLSDEDRDALAKLTRETRTVAARRNLIREGETPTHVNLVLDGWGARYKVLPDGKRSLVSLLLPGDFCDLNIFILKQMDHSIGALTTFTVATIEPDHLLGVMQSHPRITQALLWHELVGNSVQREWTQNVGARPAFERLAHLFVELFLRIRSIGLADDSSCDFPLTQYDLAEASGLTPIHVNRTLQALRAAGLIDIARKRLTIPDLSRLMAAASFSASYLHLNHEGVARSAGS